MFADLGAAPKEIRPSVMSNNPNIMASQMVNSSKFHYSLFDETDGAAAIMNQ